MLSNEIVFVEAAARLHFGVLDLGGSFGRWFGGIGASAPGPTLLLSAEPADDVLASGEDAERAAAFAAKFVAYHQLRHGVRIQVHRSLPPHTGLGSGTQLALAVARAIAEIYDVDAAAPALARAVGRAQRSAIGTWTFADGGLVVEGGRRRDGDSCGPLIARLAIPESWRCVVAVPDATPGISGSDEAEAFAQLPAPPREDVARVAHLVLMALLPAVADDDIETFGGALTEIQEITGRWFAPIQGAMFTPGPTEALIALMRRCGAFGVGQSSWGPAVYGIVNGEDAGVRLAGRVREALAGAGAVYEGAFRTTGARIWREPASSVGGRAESRPVS
jgi:beta-ribofuranosylaminobenzene 5'-phosphate synthase